MQNPRSDGQSFAPYHPYGRRTGRSSRDLENHFVHVRPFYQEPINILPHNIYISTQIPVTDTSALGSNILAYTGLLIASTYNENGLKYALGFSAAAWLLWIFDTPNGIRKILSPREYAGLIE